MLERDVASAFNTMFSEYGILAPINNSQSGWPDRLIQLPDSRVVAVEIKSYQQQKTGKVTLATFKPDQAAWLAKWQRNGGKCFLFIGITNFSNTGFVGYGIITKNDWRHWIALSNCVISEFDFISNESNVILNWFKAYTEFSYA
jgi:hypothetical protein